MGQPCSLEHMKAKELPFRKRVT